MSTITLPPFRQLRKCPEETSCEKCKGLIRKGSPLVFIPGGQLVDQDFCSLDCLRGFCADRALEAEHERLYEIQSGGQG